MGQNKIIKTIFLGLLIWSAGGNANAVSTTYAISNIAAETRTELKNDSTKDDLLKGFVTPLAIDVLRKNPYVRSFEFSSTPESRDESNASFTTVGRKSYAFINLDLPARVTMLFEINESYRICKAGVTITTPGATPTGGGPTGGGPGGRDSGSSTSASGCALRSSASVKGPLAVYGSFTSNKNLDRLMANKQSFKIDVTKSYDQKDLNITTAFSIDSNLFEKSLAEFLSTFGIKTILSENSIVSRQALLLGVARMQRQINEGILQ